MVEGNGTQVNCSSGDYGSGSIGRSGVLLQKMLKTMVVIAKLDPITEQLERGPDGLCVMVIIQLLFDFNRRPVMEKRGRCCS
jgi:hypothetical protein